VILVDPIIPWQGAPQQSLPPLHRTRTIYVIKIAQEKKFWKKVESFVCRIVFVNDSLKFDEDRKPHWRWRMSILLSVSMIWSREVFKTPVKIIRVGVLRRASYRKRWAVFTKRWMGAQAAIGPCDQIGSGSLDKFLQRAIERN
jgi:hypothetical protein